MKIENKFSPSEYVLNKVDILFKQINNIDFTKTPTIVTTVNNLSSLVSLHIWLQTKQLLDEKSENYKIKDIILLYTNDGDPLEQCSFAKLVYDSYDIKENLIKCTVQTNDIVLKIAKKISGVTYNISANNTALQKLKNDLNVAIKYYVSISSKGLVLTALSKSDYEIRNFSKTLNVSDWRLLKDVTNEQIVDLARYFGISEVYIDEQKKLEVDFVKKSLVSYDAINTCNFTPAEKKAFYFRKHSTEHKIQYPFYPPQINKVLNEEYKTLKSSKTYSSNCELSKKIKDKLQILRAMRGFNHENWLKERSIQLFEYIRNTGKNTFIVSVDGCIDSSLIASVSNFAKKLHKINVNIILVSIPIKSNDNVQDRVYELGNALDIPIYTIDLSDEHNELCNRISKSISEKIDFDEHAKEYFKNSLKSNILNYIARLTNGIILGTGNKSEDVYLGYFPKSYDNMIDFSVIHDIYKSEVYSVAEYLQVPMNIILSEPSIDLLHRQTNKNELTISYDFVEFFMIFEKMIKNDEINKKDFLSDLSKEEMDDYNKMELEIKQVYENNNHNVIYPLDI